MQNKYFFSLQEFALSKNLRDRKKIENCAKSLSFPALLNSDSSNEFEGIDRRGMTHFVENHFVKNHDQNISD
jgi:hypothetical protein